MKTWVKLLLVFGGLAALAAWVVVDGEQRDARMTAKASAVLTEVEFHPDAESSSLDETRFRFRFPADGQDLESEDTLPGDRTGDFRPGQQVPICYNPAKPKEAAIETNPAAPCGS